MTPSPTQNPQELCDMIVELQQNIIELEADNERLRGLLLTTPREDFKEVPDTELTTTP